MRIFLYLSIIFIMAVSFVLVNAGDRFAFIIPFCLAPILIAGYFYGILWSYLVSAVLTAYCIGLTKIGLDFLPMLISVAAFNIAPLVVFRFNRLFRRHLESCKNKIAQAERDYQDILEEDGQIKEFNAQLERDVLDMAKLYEITKAMSGNMEFSGILSVLKNTLGKMFKFNYAKLILVEKDPDSGKARIQKVYRIGPLKQQQSFEEKRLLRLAAGPSFTGSADLDSENIIEPDESDKALILKDNFEGEPGFTASWLFSQNEPMGILAVYDIPDEQKDKFSIITSQFSLELQRIRLYEMVQQLAIMDGLTGMFVRRHLLDRCQDEIRRAMKHKLNLSCLIVDIDFFKGCNDRHGHLVGDAVLKRIAAIIKENIREVDFAGRYGGEEFCVMLPDTASAGALHVAERLRAAVENHTFKAYDESIKITVSAGVSVFPQDASDVSQLIDCADQAMYKAKNEGRNRVCAWK